MEKHTSSHWSLRARAQLQPSQGIHIQLSDSHPAPQAARAAEALQDNPRDRGVDLRRFPLLPAPEHFLGAAHMSLRWASGKETLWGAGSQAGGTHA